VTGTNGKTTTVSLTAEMLKNAGYKAAAVGNIGVPFINWCKWLGENDAAVVEVSSFQLEQSQCFCSDIATITNITPDHIERHGTMENYIEIKKSIFKNTKEMAVMNSEEQYEVKCKKFIYSLSDENADLFVKDGIIYYRTDEELIDVISIEDLKIKGDHNILNALCALSLAICFSGGCSECFADTLRKYNLPKYRIECLGEVCGMNVFNDSKGTNIGATICAIKSMRGDTVLIMGGYDKLDDYTLFFKTLDPKIKHILLCGANTLAVLNGAKNAEKDNIIEVFEDINSAVTNAFQYTDCNNLLFSPATSSFDVYYDYKQRGKVFEELINAKRQSQ
ncbi:MAG: UDP-N-acetylmuramoyl-L-alanine--D-glutamate ligase, partial [Clostridia bacterium]|nr:UDP-N-acetylmuramoyl-L-alanine--D-glutamate ligase [Clostridia bacterium]